MKVLLGVCGSISAYKSPWIVRELQRQGAEVRVVMTPSAARFVTPLALQNVSQSPVIQDAFDPLYQSQGSWHIHWAHWADRVLVAPCSANTMARLASGQADTALTLVLLSLPRSTPLLLAPAMDPDLWNHPATQRNLTQLQADGVRVMPPEEGEMASGLTGIGRLAEPLTIARWATGSQGTSLQGRRVLITAGPTREAIDAVRFLSNHSTGKMGYALAAEASARGAEVVLISGPVALTPPPGVHLVKVESAQEMLAACQAHFDGCDFVIKAAAVADFSPAQVSSGKVKKEHIGTEWSLSLQRTPDILAWLGQHKRPGQVLVGFALETDQPEENARRKLQSKHCDLVVLNRANQADSGFGGDNNTITLISAEHSLALPALSKSQCAVRLWDYLEGLSCQ